jgi:hypothetical protein
VKNRYSTGRIDINKIGRIRMKDHLPKCKIMVYEGETSQLTGIIN